MPQFDLAAGLTSMAQTIASVVMALVFFGFYRQYRKSYLRHWMLGWSMLAINNLFIVIGIWFEQVARIPSTEPVAVVIAVIAGVTGYLQIGWLLFGVYELIRRRPVRLVDSRRITIALEVFGFLVSLLFISPSSLSTGRYFTRVGIH